MPRRISNYSSLDNAKINNAGCAQAECFIDLTKRRDPQKLKTLNQLRRLLKEQQLLQATKEAKGRFQSSHERGGHVLPRDRGQQPNELSHHQPISGYEWDELKIFLQPNVVREYPLEEELTCQPQYFTLALKVKESSSLGQQEIFETAPDNFER
ncbi:hypothetical protein NA56DRAFT_698939 [Hyaloscypha hepaticicola]|uniref:Uncharacterized protein n=1 Tax=Hyaloscypha hepaticicola TaxID=2082293 RepID=A0A2J6QHZ1_9HELO|nr:hypothetical protein NA56DRAFT_698939 [Hyaloscypha hepaticicola]